MLRDNSRGCCGNICVVVVALLLFEQHFVNASTQPVVDGALEHLRVLESYEIGQPIVVRAVDVNVRLNEIVKLDNRVIRYGKLGRQRRRQRRLSR